MLLKTGACFTKELELNCPTVVACVAALPTGLAAAAGDLVLGKDGKYHALPAAPAAPAPQTLSLVGNTVTLSGGGGSITVPDLDTQDLSLVGNVLSLTNGGSVTLPSAPGQVAQVLSIAGSTVSLSDGGGSIVLPAAAGVTFATPAETVAGTSATLAVNPADLVARENIPAQTGLNVNVALIPAPTASQSPWGVNTLGETLHYAPGLGWKIVDNRYGTQSVQPAGNIATAPGAWVTALSLVAPRAGRVIVTSHLNVANLAHNNWAGGLAINGINKTANNAVNAGPLGSDASAGSPYQTSSGNTVLTWTGNVTAGTVIELQGITIGTSGILNGGNLEYTYIN